MSHKKYLRGSLLIGAVVGIVTASLQIAGAAATTSSHALPLPTIPSQSPPEIQEAAKAVVPSDNEVPQNGSELSLSQVQQIALKDSQVANESAPSDMKVVQGSFANEWGLVQATVGNTSSSVDKLPGSANSAFFVVMHGAFTLSNVPVPPGHKSPTGTVMGLILDAHTGFVEGRYLRATTPNIESLGPVVQLNG
jgi:hypothetical protein